MSTLSPNFYTCLTKCCTSLAAAYACAAAQSGNIRPRCQCATTSVPLAPAAVQQRARAQEQPEHLQQAMRRCMRSIHRGAPGIERCMHPDRTAHERCSASDAKPAISFCRKLLCKPAAAAREIRTAALLSVVCPMYRILYSPGTRYLNASYVPYRAPAKCSRPALIYARSCEHACFLILPPICVVSGTSGHDVCNGSHAEALTHIPLLHRAVQAAEIV